MNKDEIKAILNRHFLSCGPSYNPLDELAAATEAIAALPVDRVQAMALFVKEKAAGRFYVPDSELALYMVDRIRSDWFCHLVSDFTLCSEGDCDHIRAVELYRARQ